MTYGVDEHLELRFGALGAGLGELVLEVFAGDDAVVVGVH